MTAQILDGKAVAQLQQSQLARNIEQWISNGQRKPALAVILIGEDPASQLYVDNKRRACEQVGISSVVYNLPTSISQAELLQFIDDFNADLNIDGILIQLPLPPHIDEHKIIERISPAKDVDGFHPYNLGRLAQRNPAFRPCTPYGVIKLLEHYQLILHGLNATIIGASNIVGRPMALELLNAGCTVTICHSGTRNLAQTLAEADIVIAAIGKPGVIRTNWLKQGSIIIDIGITRLADGKITGDIDFGSAKQVGSWITPVPGGIGPMTVSTLLLNTFYAAKQGLTKRQEN